MLKKTLLGTAFAVILLGGFVTSCGMSSDTNGNQTALVTMTGTVQRVNMTDTTSTGGQHLTEFLFVSDNITEDPIYLQSSVMTLDRFINERVTITGVWTNADRKVLNITTAEIAAVSPAVSNAGSKSFSSTKLGVFFSYPSSWLATERENSSIEVRSAAQDQLLVTMFSVPAGNGEAFDAWVKRNYPGQTPEEYQIGLLVGKKIMKEGQDIILVNDNTSFYTIVFNTSVQGMDSAEIQRGYGSMQTSFRFFTPGEATTSGQGGSSSEAATGTTGANTTATSTETNSGLSTSDTSSVSTSNPNAPTSTTESTSNTVNGGTSTQPAVTPGAATTPPSAQVPATPPAPSATAAQNSSIVQYLLANTGSVVGAGAQVSQVEVAGANHAYVTYTINGAKKRVLVQYTQNGGSYSAQTVATFDQGTSTTWVKTSGTNAASNEAREVYDVNADGNAKKTAVIDQGKSLYNNNQLDFQVQYPKNWYYSGENISSEGGLQKVTFSEKPLDESPEKQIELKVYPKNAVDLSNAQKTQIGGKEGYVITDANGGEQLAIQGQDGRLYMSGSVQDNSNKKVVEGILETLVTP